MPEMEVSSCLSESSSIPSRLTKTDKPQPMQSWALAAQLTAIFYYYLQLSRLHRRYHDGLENGNDNDCL